MTAVYAALGPMSMLGVGGSTGTAAGTYALDDADDMIGNKLIVPKDGTINKVGFYLSSITGSPPDYKVGIVTLDTSGRPSSSPYGGSALADYTPSGSGWKWVTLSTPATANAGDMVGLRVAPGAVAPDASNCMTVVGHASTPTAFTIPEIISTLYSTAWQNGTLHPLAIQYDDNTVYGFTLGNAAVRIDIDNAATPDEVGGKFTLPFAVTLVGVRTGIAAWMSGTVSFDVTLYDNADNVLKSWSHSDPDDINGISVGGAGASILTWQTYRCDPVSLSADTTYRITIKPTSTNNIVIAYHRCNAEADKAWLPGGTAWTLTERTNGGAWTDTAEGVAPVGILVSAIETSGGGGAYGSVG